MEEPPNSECHEKAPANPARGADRHAAHIPKRERQPKPFTPGKDAPVIVSQGEAHAFLRKTTVLRDADGNKVTFDSQLAYHFRNRGNEIRLKYLQFAMLTSCGTGRKNLNKNGLVRTYYAREFAGAKEGGGTLYMLIVARADAKGHIKTYIPCKTAERMWNLYNGNETGDE